MLFSVSVSLSHCLFPSEFIISLYIVLITLFLGIDKFYQDDKGESTAAKLFWKYIIPIYNPREENFSLSYHVLKNLIGILGWYVLQCYFCRLLYLELRDGIKESNDCTCTSKWKDSQESTRCTYVGLLSR